MRTLSFPPSYPTPLFRHGGAASGDSALDFSVSINPFGPPTSVVEALERDLHAIATYPEIDNRTLSIDAAEHFGVRPEEVMAGNGSNELIYLIAYALRPKRVAIVEPTYTEYLRASRLAGASVDHWLPENDGFQPAPFDPGTAQLVWLCNPNNPTGQIWPENVLRTWIEGCSRSIFIVDEAFMPFVHDESSHSLLQGVRALPNLLVLRSLTKFYALPGLRLGFLVGDAELLGRIRPFAMPWSVNTLAQRAGSIAMGDDQYADQSRRLCREEAAWLHEQLQAMPDALEPFPPAANFILVRLRAGLKASALAARLAESGISIRAAANFIGLDDRYFRVGVRKREDNMRLLESLRDER